jgi:hypothetical protein
VRGRPAVIAATAAVAAVGIVLAVVIASGGGDQHVAVPTTATTSPTATPASPSPTVSPKGGHQGGKKGPQHRETGKHRNRPVHFHVSKIVTVSGSRTARHSAVRRASRRAVRNVSHLLDTLYTAGFVQAAGHRHPPRGIFADFAGSARRVAAARSALLTIGPRGPDVTRVGAQGAHVKLRVLLDTHNQPSTAEAAATYRARARLDSGKVLLVESSARFFLRNEGKGWAVVGFEAHRRDRTVKR